MQQMRKQAKILKQSSMNKFNALNTTIQRLSNHDFPTNFGFKRAFYRLFGEDKRTFKFELTHHMKNLETQLNKETLHEEDSKSTFRMTNAQFQKFIHSENRLKRLNDRKLQIQECKVQDVKALDASSRYTDISGIVSDKGNIHCSKNDYSKICNVQSSEKQSSTSGNVGQGMNAIK
ncbi:hypothetical protein Tco_1358618 [Tanacetum coccineum]